MNNTELLTITGRWVFPVAGPPIQSGTVTVRGTTIESVNPPGDRTPDVRFDQAAIIPGLANPHTHLDLSHMRGMVAPTGDHIGWLKSIIQYRRAHGSDECVELAAIRHGLAECLDAGTTLIGDITASGHSADELTQALAWSVAFREIIGLTPERASASWQHAKTWFETSSRDDRCRLAFSPHAPYSTRNSLYCNAALARSPIATHLAEFMSEEELLLQHRGPFAEFLKELAVFDETGFVKDWNQVLQMYHGDQPALFVHCNYLPPNSTIPANGFIVYCPRTHAAFGHPRHPYRSFLRTGLRLALATDSLASNPDLDVLNEARFLWAQPHSPDGDLLLRLVTLAGAEALGLNHITGTLEAGKSADLVVVPLPDHENENPYDLLFAQFEAGPYPRKTMWRGAWRPATIRYSADSDKP